MNVKLDTKEKFTVLTPEDPILSANMAEELSQLLRSFMKKNIPHVILNTKHIEKIEENVLIALVQIQQEFYNDNHSFVICELRPSIIQLLEKQDLIDGMNITPSESEAWDIVQMEEIERELMRDFEP